MRLKTFHGRTLIACGICSAWALAACDDITKVTNTGVVGPSSLSSAAGAAAWYIGGTQAFVGAAQGAIIGSAMFSDEWTEADLANNRISAYYDTRRPIPVAREVVAGTAIGAFAGYSSALVTLRFAAPALRQFAPTPGSRLGQMYAYQGYLELYMAEQLCNGIPFSSIDLDGNFTYGGATTTIDTYGRAIAHFDSASAMSADSIRVLNLTRVGKGRALLGLGRYTEAAAAVASVATSFVYNLDISSTVTAQQNILYSENNVSKIHGIVNQSEGTNGINWVTANDPRVRTALIGPGYDGTTVLYHFLNFTSLGSPVPIATGIEARLIEAEAALQANNNDASTTGTGWLGILNTLRTTAITPAMATLADPGSYPARVDLLFRERAFWLFLTANRMSDMRRLVRQYGRAQNTVFPTGTYRTDGLPYGTEVNLKPPVSTEGPNAAYTGCIDRNA